jgi:hypothetical protein
MRRAPCLVAKLEVYISPATIPMRKAQELTKATQWMGRKYKSANTAKIQSEA